MLEAWKTLLELEKPGVFDQFFNGLKEYLKSKLTYIQVHEGQSYWSCGHDYHHRSVDWKPFFHFLKYCEMEGFDDFVVFDLLEEYLKKKLRCECEIINNSNMLRRERLKRVYGLGLGQPGDQNCGLVDVEEE